VGVIRNWGVSPVVTTINHLITKSEIETFNAADNDYWKTLSLWKFQDKRTKNTYGILWKNAVKLTLFSNHKYCGPSFLSLTYTFLAGIVL
jgi:hypothetical protein